MGLINMVSKLKILYEAPSAFGVGALAAKDMTDAFTQYASFSNGGFLLKKLRGSVRHVFVEPGDGGILVLAYADASAAEIETALELVNTDLATDELVEQAQARAIIGLCAPRLNGGLGSGGTDKCELYYDLSEIDIPSKGLPFLEGIGWKWCFYNTGGGAFTTGSSLNMAARYLGVKLG